jgi:hypothetical protein
MHLIDPAGWRTAAIGIQGLDHMSAWAVVALPDGISFPIVRVAFEHAFLTLTGPFRLPAL